MTGFVCKTARKAKKEPHLCAVLFQTLPTKKKTNTSPNTAQIYHPLLICLTFHSEQNETINSGEAAILDMFQSCTRSQLQCICQTSPDFRKPRVVSLISFHFFVRQFFAKQLKESTHHVFMPCNHLLNLMFAILDTPNRQIKSRHKKCLGSQQWREVKRSLSRIKGGTMEASGSGRSSQDIKTLAYCISFIVFQAIGRTKARLSEPDW